MNIRHHIASFRFALLLLVLLAPASLAQAPADGAFLPEGIEATGDTAEVRALTTWAEEHRVTDPQQTRQVAERALALARGLNDQQGIGWSLKKLGDLAFGADPLQTGEYSLNRAEEYYLEALEVFRQGEDERGVFHTQKNLATVYMRRGETQQALASYFEALEGLERLQDVGGQISVLLNIGFIHISQANKEEGRTYFERAVVLAETLDNPVRLISVLNNFGAVLSEQGAYESAEIHLRRALAIAEQEEHNLYIGVVSNNIGALFNRQGHHGKALPFLKAAEQLAKEVGSNLDLTHVYEGLGKAYMGLGQYDQALQYAREGLVLAQTMELAPRQMVAHEILSQIYEAAGNNGEALAHNRQFAALRDSVFTAEKTKIIAQMQTRYETEEKQRANERLEQELEIQALRASRWRAWMIGGVAGLLLLLGLLYNRYRLKQRANRLLEELDTAKSRFFTNISHEFRTPLTVILGGAQDMLTGRFGKMSERASAQLQAMQRNSRQLQRLIDEVLDLNRLEAGKLELRAAPGDLVRTLWRLIEADVPLAERNGIDLTFEHEVETCPRLYDQEKLEKIVGNLLSNALKFTPKGGSVCVALRCGKETEIIVSDDGPGIPMEAQAKVFERFVQVEDGSQHGGTGIGLALARELVELHGGTITLESAPGEGSTFTARLPLEKVDFDDVGALREAPLPRTTEPVPPEEFEVGGDGTVLSEQPVVAKSNDAEPDRTTVLIIEDNDDVRAYVRRSLEATYRVLEAADGETGLQKAREALPDLIVGDIMLPGIDGYEVARRLKAEADTECIPVVMLTARAAEEDQTEGYGSGAEVYVTKPFSPETLRAAIARILEERYRLRRRLQKAGSQTEGTERENGEPTLADRARVVVLDRFYDEDFGIEELASALAVSRTALYRGLQDESGLTPAVLIRTIRLEKARELLAGGEGSVSEVAYAVGFKSRSHFTRSFREHYGMPPLDVLSVGEEG